MAVIINGDGMIEVDGTSTTQGRVRLKEDTDNGTNYVELQAPASVTANRTITMPDATGTLALTSDIVGGGKLLVDVFAASGTWTAPTGVTRVKVTVFGGGGGVAGGNQTSGGQGGIAQGVYTVTPGTSYTVTVGAGGAAVSNTPGGTGGTSSFGSTLISATGGAGGTASEGARGTSSLGNIFNTVAAPASTIPSAPSSIGDNVLMVGYGFRQRSSTSDAAIAWSTSSFFLPGARGVFNLDGSNARAGGVGGAVFVEYVAP